MIFRFRNIFCPILLFACLSHPSAADQIYLKNGRTLNGLIKEETKTHVVLDIGVGSMTIARSRIDLIKRSDTEGKDRIRDEWRKKYFLHKKHVPEGLKDLASAFRKLFEKRSSAVRARQALSRGESDERRLLDEIEDLQGRLVEVSRKIEAASPRQNLEEYNALVMESNSLRAGLTLKHDEIEKTRKNRAGAMERISGYMDCLTLFESSFSRRAETYMREPEDERKIYFFDRISERLADFDREFSKTTVQTSSSHGTTIISALVNDYVRGRFILDTGAALVTISESLAQRLKLDISAQQITEVVMADGRKIKAKPVLLRSLQMGDARVEGVQAVVLPSPVQDDVDGLLGMSFLKNFVMRLDGATGKLILKQFNPSD